MTTNHNARKATLMCVPAMTAAAVASTLALTACGPDRGDPFVDTSRDGWVTIDAPIKEKSVSNDSLHPERKDLRNYWFHFEVERDQDEPGVEKLPWKIKRTVPKSVYDEYDKGDWLRLKCKGADPCEVVE